MNENLLQIGAVAIIFLVSVKEFFAYLRGRKTTGEETFLQADVKALRQRLDNEQVERVNHLHTIEVKQDEMTHTIQSMAVSIGKLETIIDERIPRKQ